MAFCRVFGPIGERRADLQAGIIASTIANCNRTKGKALTADDFMLKDDLGRPTVEQVKARFMAAFGG